MNVTFSCRTERTFVSYSFASDSVRRALRPTVDRGRKVWGSFASADWLGVQIVVQRFKPQDEIEAWGRDLCHYERVQSRP